MAEHNPRVWFSREDPREGGGPRTRSARVPRACQRQHQRELSCCWRPFQPGPGDFCSSSAWCVNCGKLKIVTDQSKSFDIFSTFPRRSKIFYFDFCFLFQGGARSQVRSSRVGLGPISSNGAFEARDKFLKLVPGDSLLRPQGEPCGRPGEHRDADLGGHQHRSCWHTSHSWWWGREVASDLLLFWHSCDNLFSRDIAGRAIVIHAGSDDLGTWVLKNPLFPNTQLNIIFSGTGDAEEGSKKTGNAGGRVACGVIEVVGGAEQAWRSRAYCWSKNIYAQSFEFDGETNRSIEQYHICTVVCLVTLKRNFWDI